MIILRQKVYATLVDGTGRAISEFKKDWLAGGGEAKLGKFTDWYKGENTGLAAANQKVTADATAKAAQRAANKANAEGVKNAAMKARAQGFQASQTAGRNSATLNKRVLTNTWNKMGTAGKVGTAAAAIGATALAAKGLKSMFDKKKEEK